MITVIVTLAKVLIQVRHPEELASWGSLWYFLEFAITFVVFDALFAWSCNIGEEWYLKPAKFYEMFSGLVLWIQKHCFELLHVRVTLLSSAKEREISELSKNLNVKLYFYPFYQNHLNFPEPRILKFLSSKKLKYLVILNSWTRWIEKLLSTKTWRRWRKPSCRRSCPRPPGTSEQKPCLQDRWLELEEETKF